MSSIEDRLRAAALAAAGTVPDGGAPPLRLPAPARRPVPRIRGLRGRLLAMAAPAAAAAAVAGVIAGTVVATGHDGAGGPPAAAVAAPRVPPPFLLGLSQFGPAGQGHPLRVDAVFDSDVTGRTLATLRPPRGQNYVAVSGAYDDRTFVLAAQRVRRVRHGVSRPRFSPTWLVRVQIRVTGHGRGQRAAYTTTALNGGVPLPAASFGAMALSPGGTALAVTQEWTRGRTRVQGLRVYDLVTGGVRSWTLTGGDADAYPFLNIRTPSWEANGRRIALTVDTSQCPDCVRLLDTASPAATVQRASRVILGPPRVRALDWNTTLISPDGSRVVRTAIVCGKASKHGCADLARIYYYSARTGRLVTAVIDHVLDITWGVLWSSPDGRLIAVAAGAQGQPEVTLTTVRNGRWTVLRPGGLITAAW